MLAYNFSTNFQYNRNVNFLKPNIYVNESMKFSQHPVIMRHLGFLSKILSNNFNIALQIDKKIFIKIHIVE